MAKQSGRPAAVACTSGTAAAHYLPAVIEAHEARVPLIVLTADRPPELREVGAGQTIDQLKLYGGAAKWFFEVGTHRATPERLRWIRQLAFRAYETAVSGRPGAVHLNFALREPLVLDAPLPRGRRRAPPPRAPSRRRRRRSSSTSASARVIVAGRHERDDGLAAALPAAAAALGAPLLADPLSGARRGPAAVAHYDELLRDAGFAAAHRPGHGHPRRRPADLQAAAPVARRPRRRAPGRLRSRGRLAGPGRRRGRGARRRPRRVGALDRRAAARERVARRLAARRRRRRARRSPPSSATRSREPAVARALAALPSEVTVFTASSMPVRDVESFWPVRDAPPRVLAHRGANGIDGTLAAAFGAAAAGARVVVHLGDVALAHDLGALLSASRLKLALTVVLVDNAGGGIFDFLPVASQTDAFEEHVATPTGPGRRARRRPLRPALRARATSSARSARPPGRCCTSAPTAPRTSPCTVACTRPSPSGSVASFERP